MSSSTTRRKYRLLSAIEKFGRPAFLSCRACYQYNLSNPDHPTVCVMSSQHSLKCSKCIALGRPCVALSSDVLDRTQESLENKIRQAEEEEEALRKKEAMVHNRLKRLRQLKKFNETRLIEEARCIDRELDAELQERINRNDLSDGEREDLEFGRQMEDSLRELQQMSPEELNSSLGVPLTSSSS